MDANFVELLEILEDLGISKKQFIAVLRLIMEYYNGDC